MPRHRGAQCPVPVHHLMSRGDRCEDIFLDDVGRQALSDPNAVSSPPLRESLARVPGEPPGTTREPRVLPNGRSASFCVFCGKESVEWFVVSHRLGESLALPIICRPPARSSRETCETCETRNVAFASLASLAGVQELPHEHHAPTGLGVSYGGGFYKHWAPLGLGGLPTPPRARCCP
jgi:hypothetical protein